MARKTDDQPHLGAFVTMTVGLLLFFGLISRIHDPSAAVLSVARRHEPDVRERHADAQRKTTVVFGARMPDASDEPEASPVPERAPSEAAPRRAEPDAPPAPAPARPRREPEKQDRRRYYAVQPGDTLWSIAARAYGSGHMHRLIREANPWIDPNHLPVGLELVLPPVETSRRDAPANGAGRLR